MLLFNFICKLKDIDHIILIILKIVLLYKLYYFHIRHCKNNKYEIKYLCLFKGSK